MDKGLEKVNDGLNKYFKSLGFPRPPEYYFKLREPDIKMFKVMYQSDERKRKMYELKKQRTTSYDFY